ncbi:MAG: hypothetical protein HYU66_12135 [Armatimonadetes bacterium]|nr:hypothetical protein [Armatimonadota bacterium]
MEPRRPARWQVELSALGLALLAGAPLLLGRVYYLDDFHGHGLPLLAAVQRAVRAGASPAWCPDVLGGYPALAAGQGGAAYPVMQVLLRVFPLLTAVALFYAFHFCLLARGMLGLLLELGASFPGALAGAAVALLGGPAAGHHFHYNILAGMAWTPALMWAAALTARRRDGRLPTLLFGAALGLMTLQSQPQFVLLAFEAVVCTAPWWRVEVSAGRFWLRLLAGVLIGKLLAAAQLVPEAQYILTYPRPLPGGRFEFLTQVGFGLREWLRLLQPDLFGSPVSGGWHPAPMLYWETRAFVGTGLLVVAVAALIGRRRGPAVRGALCLLLVGAALAAGRWNPLYHALVYLPPFSLFRVPARHIWLVHLGLAIAAATRAPVGSATADASGSANAGAMPDRPGGPEDVPAKGPSTPCGAPPGADPTDGGGVGRRRVARCLGRFRR